MIKRRRHELAGTLTIPDNFDDALLVQGRAFIRGLHSCSLQVLDYEFAVSEWITRHPDPRCGLVLRRVGECEVIQFVII